MARTLGKQLDDVQTAIEAIETGRSQSYEIEGRKMTYIDLPTLYKREEYLIRKIERYGRSFVEGQDREPLCRRVEIVFG